MFHKSITDHEVIIYSVMSIWDQQHSELCVTLITKVNPWNHLRGPLLINIFWAHKNCLWHSVLAC